MPIGAFKLNAISKAAATTGRTAKTVTAVGNAQVSTTQSKFGGASALFDGTGDWLTTAASSDINTTGDLTVEFWIRPATAHSFWMVSQGTNGTGQNNGAIDVYFSNVSPYTINARFIGQATNCSYSLGATWSATWKHIALVKSGTSALLFVDGTLASTQTYSGTAGGTEVIYYGARYNQGGNFNGNIDEIRISKTARYTTGFTPSASAFTNDSNTLLLVHANGTNGSTSFPDDNS